MQALSLRAHFLYPGDSVAALNCGSFKKRAEILKKELEKGRAML